MPPSDETNELAEQVLRILLIEDNPSDRALFGRFLSSKRLPTRVEECDYLAKALDFVAEEEIDVILLDLELPDSSGLETFFSVQRKSPAPIIVLTGYGDEDVAVSAVQSGAQDFLVKSDVNRDLLHKAIRYAIERHKLQIARRSLERQLIDVVNKEQNRIGSELHDSLGQELTGLGMLAKTLAKKLAPVAPELEESANTIVEGLQKVLQDVKVIIRGLTPVDVDGRALYFSLQNLCENVARTSSVPIEFNAAEIEITDNEAATQLYRIAQESVNNAVKHSKASKINVRVRKRDDRVVLEIVDNGCGMDTNMSQNERSGLGLRIMHHRCQLINGELEIHSREGHGTIVRAMWPITDS